MLGLKNSSGYIELLKDFSFIGVEKFYGFSGLPANCQEKALSLISSGIDSPVASFEMLKRGVTLDYIHFHSYPAINKQSIIHRAVAKSNRKSHWITCNNQ